MRSINPTQTRVQLTHLNAQGTSNIPARLHHKLVVHPRLPHRPSTDGAKEMWLFGSGGSGGWGRGERVGEAHSFTYRMKKDHLGFLPSSFWLRKAMTSPRRRRDMLPEGAWPEDEGRNWGVWVKGTSPPERKERKFRGNTFVNEWVYFLAFIPFIHIYILTDLLI